MRPHTIVIAAGAAVIAFAALRSRADDDGDDGGDGHGAAPAATAPAPGATRRAAPGRSAPSQPLISAPMREEARARHLERAAEQGHVLAKAFAADRRDPSWSVQTERQLREAFAQLAVEGARLDEVACGTKLCRYVVAFDSIERRDERMGDVMGLTHWRTRSFGDASPDDPKRYVVYAGRDRESFPMVE